MKYRVLIICLYFLTAIGSFAQKKAGVSGTLQRYNDTHYEESIFLHTNSTFLLAGETLLFKAYCLNATNNTPSNLSTIAYVELIDANATSILQAKILLKDGIGSGDLFLSSTLSSGNYTLIAYTNWMRNYSSQNFFTTQLTIINPFRKATSSSSQKTGLQISFFPEGGKLLSGVSNTVVFSAVNSKMKGVYFTGKILDNAGSTVTEFSPSLNGKGRFTFTPQTGKEYKAVMVDSLQNVSFQTLPLSTEEGITIDVQENQNSFLINLTSRSIGKTPKVKVVVHRKSIPLFEKEIQLNNEQAQMEVAKALLPIGISQVTVLSEGNEITNQRVIFNAPPDKYNIDLQLEKRNYKIREKVSFNISTKDTLLANLSVNVRKLEPRINDPYSISDYLLLQNGNVEIKNLRGASELDNQIQTQKNSYYAISPKNTEEEPINLYLPEVRGNIITGTIKKTDGSPAIKELIYLSVPSTDYFFFVAAADSSGRFFFNSDKITFNTEIVLRVNPATCPECKVKLDATGLTDYSSFAPQPLEIDSSFRKIIERRSILAQIENAYYTEKQDSILDKKPTNRFFGQPDRTYLLDDFVRFPTMEDVFIEYVAEVMVKKKGEQYEIHAMNFKERFAFNGLPLILLDGVPLFDNNQVMNYNPLLLEKIQILGRRYFYGPLEVQGIISLSTYAGDAKNISLPQREKYIGILPHKKYYSPDYSAKSTATSKIPDYRTQLYWNPDAIISNRRLPIEFYTSDIKGDFEIIVEGIQANGQLVHLKDVIHVD